jgi:hypothetical protein
MWFVAVMLASVIAGLILGPLLGRAADEQTAEPGARVSVNRIAAQNRVTTHAPTGTNRIREHARLN